MNEAGSAGGGQKGHVSAPPAVFSDRRSNYSETTQMSNVGSAVPATQMSQIGSVEKINPSDQNSMQTAAASRTSAHYESGDNPGRQNIKSVETVQQNSALVKSGISIGGGGGGCLTRTQSAVTSTSGSSIVSSNSHLVTTTSTSSSSSLSSQSADLNLSPPKKRVKISDDSDIINDAVALEKAILEYNFTKLKNIKYRHSEYVAELFFLQNNGNMMEYPTWRKKSNTQQQFIHFMKSHRLEPPPLEESDQSSRPPQQTILPHGAEIKIPGVGATPVAVSTTLPAAVVQLSQQGGTPLVPDVASTDKRKMALPVSAQSPSQEQFSVKARQEVYVLQRVSELQREGLWMEKRLPKVQEPQRPKAHWDYLLEEMAWMATDFAQERKWKKAAAKKCARMVQKHFQEKALAAQKAEKAQEMQLKRIASFIAKEIKIFWSDVEKLVAFKQQQKIELKKKIAMDQQLSYIVSQSEKLSIKIVEGLNRTANDASAAASLNSSRISSPKPNTASDDEFEPDNVSDDDEETISKAELEDVENVDDEVAALQKESEMELDAFISGLPKDYLQNRDKIVLSDDDEQSDEQSDEEFKATGDSDDDEDTIIEQEQNENKDDHQMEIDELNAENNLTIDELMAKYKSAPKSSRMDIDSDDDSTDNESSEESNQSDDDEDVEKSDKEDTLNESFGLKSLLEEDSNKLSQADKDDLINDAAAIAERIQPKGNTLSSTNVITPVPVLLKHTLREYQHIGLDWLVTMHDQKLNGILADEMGLGKTIQTISLLAHLACVKGNWGPHLIVVPSSVMLNWEMEFKKWCPGFKILTYYGTQKERKQKRIGWTKVNAFHICITSYKLVIQDHQSFRRKKWKYLILDEAQNIKNFKSQRWQLLLNFSTEQRLLLTGTPLQNNLMELWSLMHFLMPHVFQSHREFKEWFSNPMTGMIEGNTEYNNSIIQRLHKVLRPFLLRRLKSEVEKQMPKKYEHVVMCRLSNRQRYLYDDFMSRAKTKETLASGNLLSVINVLMQLRKVCNHPNMFEVRPTISPFRMDGLSLRTTSLVANMLDYDPFNQIDLNAFNLVLVQLEMCLTAYVAYRIKRLQTPKRLIEEIDSSSDPPPQPPSISFKMHLSLLANGMQKGTANSNCVKVGTSPAMKTERTKSVPQSSSLVNTKSNHPIPVADIIIPPLTTSTPTQSQNMSLRKRSDIQDVQSPQSITPVRRQVLLTPTTGPKSSTILTTSSGQRLTFVKSSTPQRPHGAILTNSNRVVPQQSLSTSLGQQFKQPYTQSASKSSPILPDEQSEFLIVESEALRKERRVQKLQLLSKLNGRKCDVSPVYGNDLRETMFQLCKMCENAENIPWNSRGYVHCQHAVLKRDSWSLTAAIKSFEQRTDEMRSLFGNFVIFVPAVSAPEPCLTITHPSPWKINEQLTRERIIRTEMSPKLALLHPIISAMSTQFPDPRLIQYDCGKLQTLDRLLRQLKSESHRVLIFTQMTRMLDVLEAFLNYHGHIYLRLDGTTRIEQRQVLMDRFNNDKRIFVFILSTRSGGVGVNLTGADTVIFYDSDWNPTMDAQAQDRCHRIGQTRDVHIYRLVSEKTIEENILKKANQKRLLGDLAIEGGNFTTAYFKGSTIQDLFSVDNNDEDASSRLAEVLDRDRDRRHRLQENLATTSNGSADEKSAIGALESALAAAEDEQDVEATKIASAEVAADLVEFDESIPIEEGDTSKVVEMSKAEQEVENMLSPIERYAMRFVEETGGLWTEQLRSAEAEIEQQRREWEANRLAALRKEEEEAKRAEEEENQLLTYSGVDARNQVNNKSKKPANRNLGRNKRLASKRRQTEIVKPNRRSRNMTPSRRSLSNRRSQSANASPKKRKIEETNATKNQTISRSIPKRLCRQTNNSRSETTDNDNDVSSDGGNASSNESKKGTSDSFVDSEEDSLDVCSLDVMYDEQQSESNSNQAPSSSGVDNEKSDVSDNNSDNAESDSDLNGKECNAKQASGEKRRTSSTNRLDINSPRTRSRGTVKLNLWTLDDSPILPSYGGRSKRNQTKSFSNELNDKSVSENTNQLKATRSRSNSPSEKSNGNDELTVRSRRNRSKSQSNERSRSPSLSNDTDGNAEDGSKSHSTEASCVPTNCIGLNSLDCQSNHKLNQDRRNTITVMKLAQIKDGLDGSKPLKTKRSAAKKITTTNGRSSSTLDSWLSSSKSAKIVLNKDDDAIAKHLTEMAGRTRRSSTLKIHSENGPS